MARKAGTALTKSLLAAAVTIALGTTLAACASGAGTAASSGRSAAPSASAGSTSGSAGSGSAAGSGTAPATGGTNPAGAGPNGLGRTGSIPAAARTPICPPPGLRFRGLPPGSGQAIPPGFTAIAIVRCVLGGAIGPSKFGGFTQQEVAVTGLGPVLAALRLPSAVRSDKVECILPLQFLSRIALIGSDGAVIYPRVPVGVCGIPLRQVIASLDALHWILVGTTVQPQRLDPPGAIG
jgi:hypothetical protein